MSLSSDIQELIDQYLSGQLKGEALRDFEMRMATDEALATEVEFQREMFTFLADTSENELRRTLQRLSDQVVEPKEEEDKGWFWWLFPAGDVNLLDWLFGHPARQLVWLLPLLLIAGWWFSTAPKIPTPSDDLVGTDTAKLAPPVIPIDTARLTPIVEEEIQQPVVDTIVPYKPSHKIEPYFPEHPKADKVVSHTSAHPGIIPEEKEKVPERTVEVAADATDTTRTKPQEPDIQFIPETMASFPSDPVEYLSHPILQELIVEAENTFPIVADDVKSEYRIAEGMLTNFYFSGKLFQKKKGAKKGLQFYLFSNQAEDYENFTPIASIPIKGTKVSKGVYQYEILENFELAPAKYYYLIRDKAGEKDYYIGTFSVIVEE